MCRLTALPIWSQGCSLGMRSGEQAGLSIVWICCCTMKLTPWCRDSCPVGMGIVGLQHCISPHVSYKGDSYWDKNFMDVAMCIQFSIENVFSLCHWSQPTPWAPWKDLAGSKQLAARLSPLPLQTWVLPTFLNKKNLASSEKMTFPHRARFQWTCSQHHLSRAWRWLSIISGTLHCLLERRLARCTRF